MTLAVISDSHGDRNSIKWVVEKVNPTAIIFLGDGIRDLKLINEEYPNVKIHSVRGNCDFAVNEDAEKILELNGHKLFMTHGHLYNVKSGYNAILTKARNMKSDILLFGHTHRQFYEYMYGMHVMNPGSISEGYYSLIKINNKSISCHIASI